MERIQAIAQNVSDIAVKVDQILRHSLLLHSKGGLGAGVSWWGPDFSTQAPWFLGAWPQALSGMTWGSTPTLSWRELRSPWSPQLALCFS